mgnify:CR=1 FL=1
MTDPNDSDSVVVLDPGDPMLDNLTQGGSHSQARDTERAGILIERTPEITANGTCVCPEKENDPTRGSSSDFLKQNRRYKSPTDSAEGSKEKIPRKPRTPPLCPSRKLFVGKSLYFCFF